VVVAATLAGSSVAATIQTASIDTGNPDRDDHVRMSDVLDVERRPTIEFRSTSISEAVTGGSWRSATSSRSSSTSSCSSRDAARGLTSSALEAVASGA
jgi:hypothetical protein